MKNKKKGGSVFSVLFVIILVLIVAATAGLNLIFSGDGVPQIAGNYLYMQESGDMAPDIPEKSLVIAQKAGNKSISPGSKVLCYSADNSSIGLRVIYQITVSEMDGTTLYYPGTAVDQGSELTIPRTNIFAICDMQSQPLYTVVHFATSVPGLLTLLVLPCIIMIIMLLVRIAKNSADDEEDEEAFEEFDEFEEEAPKPKKSKRAESPLFEASSLPAPDASIEQKKSSISEHFEQKPVNENSPYQKAVKERTMRFQIQQQNIEEAKRKQEEAASGRRVSTQVLSTQEVEEMVHRQQHDYQTPSAPFASQPEYHRPEHETEPRKQETAPKPVAKVSTSPNIDDIINPSQFRASKNGQKVNTRISSTDSIDDLIRALESEKKKL